MKKLTGSKECFVCGQHDSNPRSLGLSLFWDEENKEVNIPFCPDDTWCGYSGVVHGGIIASVLDDAMGWAAKQTIGDWSVTADFHIRYRKPTLIGGEYVIKGRVEEVTGRKTKTTAVLLDGSGNVLADSDAVYVRKTGLRAPEAASS
ncbi:phenylacetic acid degradation protein [Synergistales bacterium]|nr:phenylacetic acid degradation protein [Synergistales bacterium]